MERNYNKLNIVQKITDRVVKNILTNSLITNNDRILVAVSGGPDSMCLLDTLYNIKAEFKSKYNIDFDLAVAHVNHMIREESEAEKEYVEHKCNELNIKFHYLKVDVVKLAKDLKLSEETFGRKARYEFFNELLYEYGYNKIAVAHNLDDNVETILLNIIRGSGLKGLIGMEFEFNNIIRPLLNIEKSDITKYCSFKNINPCIDKTNLIDKYMRNKIRLKLIPQLKNEYNSNIVQNIIRMKEIAEVENDFLEKYTNEILNNCIIQQTTSEIVINFSNILKEHVAIQNRVVRNIINIKLNNLDGIEKIHIDDIIKLFNNNIKGKKYIIGKKFTIEIKKKFIAIIY